MSCYDEYRERSRYGYRERSVNPDLEARLAAEYDAAQAEYRAEVQADPRAPSTGPRLSARWERYILEEGLDAEEAAILRRDVSRAQARHYMATHRAPRRKGAA